MVRKIKVGLAGISFQNFWGFKQSQYQKQVKQLKDVADEIGLDFVAVPETFENAADSRKAAAKLKDADLVIFDICAYPEGKAANVFFDSITSPLALWSRNEMKHNTNIGHNSFCGANFLGGCLQLRNQKFRQFFGSPKSKEFKARLSTAAQLIGAAKAAAGSNIGLFGEGVVPKFYDIDISEENRKVLQKRWNIKFVSVSTEDLVKKANSYDESNIKREAGRFKKYFDKVEITEEDIIKQTRLFQALMDFTKQKKFAAAAIRCWPELQSEFGAWPCPSMSVMNEMGIPTACEGDPGGALDMLLAKQMTKEPSTLVDIVDWNDNDNRVSIWHCGPAARSWADENGATLMYHNVDGAKENGQPNFGLPGIVDMQFASGKVSVFRTLGAIDDEFAFQGQIVKSPETNICGSYGAVSKPSLYGNRVEVGTVRRQIFDRVVPHHYTAARGHCFD